MYSIAHSKGFVNRRHARRVGNPYPFPFSSVDFSPDP